MSIIKCIQSSKKILFGLILVSCNNQKNSTTEPQKAINSKPIKEKIEQSNNHGYNELADSENRESFTISEYNTDNPEVKNIIRPKMCTIKTDLDTNLLFDVWTNDPDGPHADFMLTSDYFHVVDYDGNGDMPYELIGNKLKIFYNDFIQEGFIISIDKDKLKIKWKDFENNSEYVRWTQ